MGSGPPLRSLRSEGRVTGDLLRGPADRLGQDKSDSEANMINQRSVKPTKTTQGPRAPGLFGVFTNTQIWSRESMK